MKSNIASYQIGTLVKVNRSFMGEPEGVIALVYEHYGAGGLSLITQNGKDLGGFSVEDQDLFLEYWRDTGLVYRFENVMQLNEDWRKGVFKIFFSDLSPHPVKAKKGI